MFLLWLDSCCRKWEWLLSVVMPIKHAGLLWSSQPYGILKLLNKMSSSMSELCGPLKPRSPGPAIKMCWKLHFPISSGFGWRHCDVWCKSNRIRVLFFSALLYGIVIQLSVQDDQQLRMTSSINAEATERLPCYGKVRDLIPRQCVSASSHSSSVFHRSKVFSAFSS